MHGINNSLIIKEYQFFSVSASGRTLTKMSVACLLVNHPEKIGSRYYTLIFYVGIGAFAMHHLSKTSAPPRAAGTHSFQCYLSLYSDYEPMLHPHHELVMACVTSSQRATQLHTNNVTQTGRSMTNRIAGQLQIVP